MRIKRSYFKTNCHVNQPKSEHDSQDKLPYISYAMVYRSIGRSTKLKLFKTLVRPVLLYGCEAWKLTVAEEKKLDRFQFTCLRRILRVWWPQRIRNDTISQITGVRKISDEIRRRRWNWIGHVLRKDRNDDCMVVMGCQPERKRKVGRPKITWRRIVERKCRQERWTSWAEARTAAKDRTGWKAKVAALCALWPGEN